jgi:hypothetical protein
MMATTMTIAMSDGDDYGDSAIGDSMTGYDDNDDVDG